VRPDAPPMKMLMIEFVKDFIGGASGRTVGASGRTAAVFPL